MNRPRFSIVLPTYNRERTLVRAIESVLRQSCEEWELIVVDDGSTDGTSALLARQLDRRVRTVMADHRGVSAARNAGIRVAAGDYITFLDSDDHADHDWLACLSHLVADRRCALAFCAARYATDSGQTVSVAPPRSLGPLYGGLVGVFLPGTYAVARDLVLGVGGFDEELRYSEHSELGIRLALAGHAQGSSVASTDSPLVTITLRNAQGRLRSYGRARLDAVERMLSVHAQLFAQDRNALAMYHWIAAVDHLRGQSWHRGLTHLVAAIRRAPVPVSRKILSGAARGAYWSLMARSPAARNPGADPQ